MTTVIRQVMGSYETDDYFYNYFICESSGSQYCTLHVNEFVFTIKSFYTFHNAVFSLSPYFALIYIMPLNIIKNKLLMRRKSDSSMTMSRRSTRGTITSKPSDADIKV